jgi:hypothetical protein
VMPIGNRQRSTRTFHCPQPAYDPAPGIIREEHRCEYRLRRFGADRRPDADWWSGRDHERVVTGKEPG